ncbi:MAG: hypothetical protein JRI68_26450 [Deltaproteobacteria bacterium]|nr:hypothetical protein [Deltaproteobacteria bacterium]
MDSTGHGAQPGGMVIDTPLPCSEQSLQTGEPMLGTAAAGVGVWLLLEHRGPWAAELGDCELEPAVRQRLDELESRYSSLRVLLIRRPEASGPLSLYVVTTGGPGAVHHFDLTEPADLCAIDVAEIISGEATTTMHAHPLYLVCTHGQRDACCGHHGTAFFEALAAQDPAADVWQSSHQGGHRFAPTVLYLPAGIQYGRLEPGEAATLVEAHNRGEIFAMCRYRGQTRYERPAQSAEAWLREQQALVTIEGIELIDQSSLAGGRYAVQFRTQEGMWHRLVIESRLDTVGRRVSCTAEVPELPTWYDVVRHEAHTRRVGR